MVDPPGYHHRDHRRLGLGWLERLELEWLAQAAAGGAAEFDHITKQSSSDTAGQRSRYEPAEQRRCKPALTALVFSTSRRCCGIGNAGQIRLSSAPVNGGNER